MSLATSIKDFSDTLNHIHSVNASPLSILSFLQEFVFFIIKFLISGIAYIFTFEWFRDFSYLPLLNPTLHTKTINFASDSATSYLPENGKYWLNSFFTDPVSHFFSFSSFSINTTNCIFSGLVNSFFFSLPFSLPQLITIRRLFSQGIQGAIASFIGITVAHSIFLISIFYGFRFLIIPWFSLEPLTYVLGFAVNVLIIKELIQGSTLRFEKNIYLNASGNLEMDINARQKSLFFKKFDFLDFVRFPFAIDPRLLRIAILSFILTWCEELNMFSSITNLTLNAQNTYLDLYPSINVSHSFVAHTIYVVSFILGNCIFSLFFYYLFFKSGSIIVSWINFIQKISLKKEQAFTSVDPTSVKREKQNRKIRYTSKDINDAINKLVMLFIITFTFASFPYYGLDYLLGKIGGFLPEDPAYKESILSPTKINVNKKNTLFIKAESTDPKKQGSLIDINNFDNGIYLNNLDFNKFDNFPYDSTGSISRTTSFEKSNYRQENAWIRRNYLSKSKARPRKNSENGGISPFHKAFKDPKNYYQKVQLESDRKQSQNQREIQGKNPSGFFVERSEGVLVEEVPPKIQNFWSQVFGFPNNTVLTNMKKKVSEINMEERLIGKLSSNKDYNTNDPSKSVPPFLYLQNNQDFNNSIENKDKNQEKEKDNELDLETNIFGEEYTKGVKKKNSDLPLKKVKSLSTKNIIKRKFILNPIYKTLLETDIDAFMARQPITYNIAPNQEYDLHKKRVILERYYNWLRYYSPLQKNLQNLYNIENSQPKSFVDSAFHHQFKGTFKIVKRLFPITFDSNLYKWKSSTSLRGSTQYTANGKSKDLQENSALNRILSYDQILYKELSANENPFLHEEILLTNDQINSQGIAKAKTKAFVKSKELDEKLQLQELDEDLNNFGKVVDTKGMFNTPFIEESDSSPFYAGWDETLRRFVITNNFLVEEVP